MSLRTMILFIFVILNFGEFINAADEGKLRIAREKCEQYSELAQRKVEILSLLPFQKPKILKAPDCDHPAEPLIVGGKPAEYGEFPHMVAIGFQENDEIVWDCGGTLISERFVLTAAHCTFSRNGPPVKVRLGVTNLKEYQHTQQDFGIAEMIKHPDYTSLRKYNDIALFKLDRDVTISKQVRPACLWPDFHIITENTLATGWGMTEHGGPKSDKLLKVTLQFFERARCERSFGTNRALPDGVNDNMICAGHLKGGKDTCNGDSGGPLVITKEENRCVYYVVGITSFGRYCAAANSPAIYTRVSPYVDWIVDTVW